MTELVTVETDLAQSIKTLRDLNLTKLNIASISDIHLNHPNTPTELIIRNLMTYAFPDNQATRDLDIIFIDGDVTDRIMDFASDNAILVRKWVAHLLHFCAKNNIVLRILEGTKLHDWGQGIIFIELNNNHNIGCDVAYFNDIAIEHFDQWDIDVLYIPDEIRASTDITWDHVCKLMKERGLEMVDLAIMHGQFAYQLPEMANVPGKVHDKDKYESIVRHYILVGHIHQHRPNGKVIPNGSFDRLAQGEEDTKGHVRIIKGKMHFVPNLGAMRYFKINAVGKQPDEIIHEIAGIVGDTNKDKFKTLLLANRGDAAFELVKRLSKIFVNGVFDVQNSDKQKKRVERQVLRKTKVGTLPVLTRSNLLHELTLEIERLEPSIAKDCVAIAEGIISAVK